MTRATYNLYVDESGSFGGPGQPSVVCGVLEDATADVPWPVIRSELARALPFIDYPFHAAELNWPSAWVAAVLRRRALDASDSPEVRELRLACEPAARAVLLTPRGIDPALEAFVSAVAEDRKPDSTTLWDVNGWLHRTHPRLLRELHAYVERQRRRLSDTFRQVFHSYQHGELTGVAAVALPSDGTAPGDRYSDASAAAVRRDAYVRALETLFERVLCLVRGPRPCRIDLWVATRDVQTKRYGTLDLARNHVQQIAERAHAFPRLAAASGGTANAAGDVLLTSARGIVRYDAGAPMGLVIADFLSNRLYHRLRSHVECSFESIRQRIRAAMSLPLVCAPVDPHATDALPTVCADGRARARIREAYLGQVVSDRDLRPPWNREQAASWIDFAGNAGKDPRE